MTNQSTNMEMTQLNARMEAVERMTALFKMERMVHLFVTTSSLIMLIGCAGYLVWQSKDSLDNLTVILPLMFGSSGLIAYSANRLLRMWDQALRILAPTDNDEEK